jgi:S-adenosylmethionine synthetase
VLAGEITTTANVDYIHVARERIKRIGYDNTDTASTTRAARCWSPTTSRARTSRRASNKASDDNLNQGAGDQGLMFGYACDETPVLMPLPIHLSHRLVERQAHAAPRRPPALAAPGRQVAGHHPLRVDGKPHSDRHRGAVDPARAGHVELPKIREAVIEEIIKPVLPKELIKGEIKYLVNPTGRFVIGGPQGDCGLTGRKIIVDTYGGAAPHGGGAFSGKDPSKVDRSAAYAGRYVAKNIVAAGLASKCLVQISYAIGVAQPTSVMVTTHGTGKISDEKIAELVKKHFDLRPKGIVQMLDLLRPIYQKTAAYGHFGRDEPEFSWEATDKAAALRADAGL